MGAQDSTRALLQENGLLTPLVSTSLQDARHDWRLLPLVSTHFLAAWQLHNVQVLKWRVAFLENTVAATLERYHLTQQRYNRLLRRVEDFEHECSCGCAVGYN